MMTVQDFLTPKEIVKYNRGWENFKDKYKLNSEYHVHSGKCVISQVFRFKDKPLFRAHIFNKKLRNIEPYFISKKHISPFWHITHYLTVLEQMYHASMREIRETDKFVTKDVPQGLRLSELIFWRDNVSVELIWKPKRQTEKYSIEDCYFSLYNDKTNKIKGRAYIRTFIEQRYYVRCMEKLKQGGKEALESLIRKIEMQEINLKRLIKPRKMLKVTKNYLINELRKGNIPKTEIHNFFSFWDKN